MEPPYRPGEMAVFLSEDRRGVRVRQTVVMAIEQDGDGWNVRTVHGADRVDERGEGPQILPFDQELREIVGQRGSDFIIRSTFQEAQHQRSVRERSYDRTHDRGPDYGR